MEEGMAVAGGGGAGIREGPLGLECQRTVLHGMPELEEANLLRGKIQMDDRYPGGESPEDKLGGESVK